MNCPLCRRQMQAVTLFTSVEWRCDCAGKPRGYVILNRERIDALVDGKTERMLAFKTREEACDAAKSLWPALVEGVELDAEPTWFVTATTEMLVASCEVWVDGERFLGRVGG